MYFFFICLTPFLSPSAFILVWIIHRYEDGDEEDLSWEELDDVLLPEEDDDDDDDDDNDTNSWTKAEVYIQ